MTMRKGRILALFTTALLTTVLLLVGYGQLAASDPRPRQAAGSVSLGITGGIAGVQRGIEVRPNGSVLLTGGRGGKGGSHAARRLSSAEDSKLDSLLAAVDFADLPSRSISATSRDQFEYELRYDGHSLVTDRSTDLGPADDLIEHLESCMRARQ